MEGLIIAILIGLVTSFMNRKEKSKETSAKPFMPQKQPPTVETAQPHRSRRSKRPRVEVKSLEDFTRDVMAQLSTKEAPKKEQVVEAVQPPVEKAERPAMRQPIEERVKARQQTSGVDVSDRASFVLPTNRQAIRQAIIMAEVLGKPKAKQ